MTTVNRFYEWFVMTDELEVCRALANEMHRAPGSLTEEDLQLLARDLLGMDEVHAASAIVLLSHNSPRLLLPHLPWLLADRRGGVWCAAERAILLLPRSDVTWERLEEFRSAIRERTGSLQDCYALKTLSDRLKEGKPDRKGQGPESPA